MCVLFSFVKLISCDVVYLKCHNYCTVQPILKYTFLNWIISVLDMGLNVFGQKWFTFKKKLCRKKYFKFYLNPGACLNIKMSYQYRNPIIKIRQYHGHLIFIMEIPIPWKIHFILKRDPDLVIQESVIACGISFIQFVLSKSKSQLMSA